MSGRTVGGALAAAVIAALIAAAASNAQNQREEGEPRATLVVLSSRPDMVTGATRC